MAYTPPELMTEEQLLSAIAERFQHWDQLMAEGSTTPGAPDGEDINLVRNHILYYRHYLNELRSGEDFQATLLDALYPSANRPVPPEVPSCFMVRGGKYPNRVNRVYYPILTYYMDLDRNNWKPEEIF